MNMKNDFVKIVSIMYIEYQCHWFSHYNITVACNSDAINNM